MADKLNPANVQVAAVKALAPPKVNYMRPIREGAPAPMVQAASKALTQAAKTPAPKK